MVRYVAVREAGGDPLARAARPRLIDAFMPKIEELVDRSKGKIRADIAHRKITAMGYRGSERSTRRAVAEVKEAWRADRRKRYRPWIPEPGMWLQWDWGDGPRRCRVARGGAGHHRPHQPRGGRDRPAPAAGPGQPVHLRRALPGPSRWQRAAAAPAPPRTQAEAEFLEIGDGAQRWLAEAAASGAQRIRSKMARAVELAAPGEVVIADEAHSAQPGTSGWARLGTGEAGR